jgi:hypothetical protein
MNFYKQGLNQEAESPTHKAAKNKTIFYLKSKYKIMTRPEYPILVDNYRHRYDIVGFYNDDQISFYEDDSSDLMKIPVRKFLNMSDRELVYSEYKNLLDRKVVVCIEIDNLTTHTHTEHQIADGVASQKAKQCFNNNLVFLRLLKEEINGKEKDMMKYFEKKLDPEMARIFTC